MAFGVMGIKAAWPLWFSDVLSKLPGHPDVGKSLFSSLCALWSPFNPRGCAEGSQLRVEIGMGEGDMALKWKLFPDDISKPFLHPLTPITWHSLGNYENASHLSKPFPGWKSQTLQKHRTRRLDVEKLCSSSPFANVSHEDIWLLCAKILFAKTK